MRKNSIVLKLFTVTVLFFAVILCIFMTGQALFFKSFYLSMKTSDLQKNLEKFSQQYDSENWDAGAITRNINKFADQNNAQIAILDDKGNAKYTPSFEFVVKTPDKGNVKIPLNNIIYLEGFQKLHLAVGAEIEVSGFFSDDLQQVGFLSSIKSGDEEWENSNNSLFTEAGVALKELTPVYVTPGAPVTAPAGQASLTETAPVTNTPATAGTQGTDDAQATTGTQETNGANPATDTQETNDANPATGAQETIGTNPATGSGTPANSGQVAKPAFSTGSLSLTQSGFKQLKGTIVSLDLPSQISQITNYSQDLLWSSIGYWNSLHMLNQTADVPGKMNVLHYTSPTNGMDNLVLVKPLAGQNRTTEYLFAVSSLQPVGEAVGAMQSYYIYAFIAAMALIAGMALLFSRFVSRPLIKMNKVAVRMAGLDFSEEVAITTNDELGSLAASLNRLSRNLGASLSELKSANEQLKLDIEKEKELETMRKEFVSSVSHELKTPLGVIKGFAEGIKDHIAEEKKDHYLNVILEEIEKMDVLVLDLLDLAKLESNAYELEPESFPVAELLKDVESRLAKRIKDKKLHIRHEFGDANLLVHADLRRIEQVVTNVLDNAIRHADEGGTLRLGTRMDEDGILTFIENSGPPIPEEELGKVWERFYRSEKSRDRKTGGTGLGLSIVKNILQMHESRFSIENTDIGVKFSFTLKPSA